MEMGNLKSKTPCVRKDLGFILHTWNIIKSYLPVLMILAAPIILSSLFGASVENGEWIPHIFIEMTFKTK